MRGGATAELSSGVSIATMRRSSSSCPASSRMRRARRSHRPSSWSSPNIPKKGNATDANVEIRGVGEQAFGRCARTSRSSAGKKFGQGLRELIVGKGALAQFVGLDPGSTIKLGNQQWTIIGAFESGDAHDSELWGDVEIVSATYRRQGYQSVTVRLTSPDALDQLKAGIAADPRLKVDAKTTNDYYSAQSENLTKVIRVIGIVIGVIMGIGAVFGALNTMYAAVATRAREIATLRAIGFRGLPVVVSVLLETMLLAFARRPSRRVRRLADLQQLHGVDARPELQPGRFRVQGVAGAGMERPQMGARDRVHRRTLSRVACSTAAGDDGVA